MLGIALPALVQGAKALLKNTNVGKKIGNFVGGLFGNNKGKVSSGASGSHPVFTVPVGTSATQGIATTAQTNKKKDKISGGDSNTQAKIDKIGGDVVKGKLDKMEDQNPAGTPVETSHIKGLPNNVLYIGAGVLALGIVYALNKR